MTAAIAIRDETRDALQKLAKKANTVQNDLDVCLSDVIDGLLRVATDLTGEEEVLDEIWYVAKKN